MKKSSTSFRNTKHFNMIVSPHLNRSYKGIPSEYHIDMNEVIKENLRVILVLPLNDLGQTKTFSQKNPYLLCKPLELF